MLGSISQERKYELVCVSVREENKGERERERVEVMLGKSVYACV